MNELNILYLEDSQQDADLTARVLKNAGIKFRFRLVDKHDEYTAALREQSPDLVLADHSLFHFNSLEALRIFKENNFDVPFILVTGTVSEEFAVSVLNEGANDYVLKDNLARLPSAIMNALEKFRIKKEREQYFNNIAENEKMLQQAEQLAHFGSWEFELATQKMKCSDELFRICGYEPQSFEPSLKKVITHVHPDDRARVEEQVTQIITSDGLHDFEFRIIDRKHVVKHVHIRLDAEYDGSGKKIKLRGFVHDITEHKHAQEKLLASVSEVAKLEKELIQRQLAEQKLITEVTIKAQEKERNELAKELHDNINQMLATVKIFLNVAIESEPEREEMVVRSYGIVERAVEEIRKLSRSLSAPSLGDISLFEALNRLVRDLNLGKRFNVNLDLDDFTQHQLDSDLQLMLYRIVQEQINNVNKYSGAKNVTIQLSIREKNIRLMIKDDGQGFDTRKKSEGIGLQNIRSRVEFYSGKMNIESAPGKGCRLEITVPVQPA